LTFVKIKESDAYNIGWHIKAHRINANLKKIGIKTTQSFVSLRRKVNERGGGISRVMT
jgi:hypothetical protein